MDMDDDHDCDCPPPGSPAWMATFADLMSLLMCFFVLLLAFSEMDAKKFKQVAGSMDHAFGVQNIIKKKDVPRGTSIIAREFSPGRPDPTPLNVVQQKTTDITKSTLDVFCEEGKDAKAGEKSSASTVLILDKLKELIKQTENDAVSIASEMEKEIRSGQIEIETKGQNIVIRVRENGSFASGSERLQADFIPIMARIRDVLAETPGTISVEGHSDSIPIRTARFRSNWDLSAARAVSVAHELLLDDILDKSRLRVSGFADSKPLVAEDSPGNRAINRRVEIVISQEEIQNPDKEMSLDGTFQDIIPSGDVFSSDVTEPESVENKSSAESEPNSTPEPVGESIPDKTETSSAEIELEPSNIPSRLENPIKVNNDTEDELF
ncbi:MAG: flagellar motor protein MotB [Pseudomonadales bacterium]|nr:flagellar motor protein MotB [Pseudomonadales bacterium]